jgi:hypothetical protein
MSGTNSALSFQSIISNAEAAGVIIGTPGTFSLSVLHSVMAVVAQPAIAVAQSATFLTPGQTALVQSAVAKSNAAAAATPSAASGSPTSASTPITIIISVAKGLPLLDSTIHNIQTFEAGATAKLNWWGWTLNLSESSTKAFEALLTTDLAGFASIAAALTAVSAPLAAAGAIISAVATGLNGWVVGADTGKGVTINGYLWVGVLVTGNT